MSLNMFEYAAIIAAYIDKNKLVGILSWFMLLAISGDDRR